MRITAAQFSNYLILFQNAYHYKLIFQNVSAQSLSLVQLIATPYSLAKYLSPFTLSLISDLQYLSSCWTNLHKSETLGEARRMVSFSAWMISFSYKIVFEALNMACVAHDNLSSTYSVAVFFFFFFSN